MVNQDILNGDVGGGISSIRITSGFFQLWRSSGILTETQLFNTSIGALCLAFLMVGAGWFHYHKSVPTEAWFNDVDSMLNHHLAGLLGLGSLAWAGHIVHVAGPINKCLDLGFDPLSTPLPHAFITNPARMEALYPGFDLTNFLTLNWADLHILSFFGGVNPLTCSLWMTDIAHHHLAIAVVFIVAGHLYETQFTIGSRMTDLLRSHNMLFINSWHSHLSINLALLGSLSILFSHHVYAMPPYPYIAFDHPTQLSLFTHHMWIGGFFIVGAAAHAALFMVYDYQLKYKSIIDRVLGHKYSIIVHLNWVHSFGLYIHNDTMNALGRTSDMFSDTAIQFQPVFAQWIQHFHINTLIAAMAAHTLFSVDQVGLMPIELGTSDLLVHHIHAFTIHVTVLILLKGVLFARNSRLIADKALLGFRFPCDGPGRGGTCQVSTWVPGLFWMYNSISIVIFHFSWKMQSDVWGTITPGGAVSHITDGNFARSSNTINGWLRDFLWSQSSQVIQSYGSALSGFGLMFLGGHFVWAFSLIVSVLVPQSWQELIESIVWAHQQLNCAPTIYPRALSITQGRAVGVAHYLLGGIVTTWAFFLARTCSEGV